MGVPAYPLLTALFSPVSAAEFLERAWPAHPLEVHGSPERLPPVLRDPAFASAASLAQRYNGRLRFTHGGSEQMPDAGSIAPAALLDMGLTVQFVDIDGCVANAWAFARQLEHELGLHEGSISLSAFAAARDNGLPCHYDAAELVSVQLAGHKLFHYAPMREIAAPCGNQYSPNSAPFDDLYPQAGDGFPSPAHAPFQTAHMRPGSVLFLPRGYWHHTSATESSLSVSIAIGAPPALRSLLDQLRCLLLQDPRWRLPIYAHDGEDEARKRAQELLATVPAIAARVSAQDLLDAPARLDWRLAHITATTRFQRTPNARVEVQGGEGAGDLSLRFVIGGERQARAREYGPVTMPRAMLPLLRWIEARDRGPFASADAVAAHPPIAPAAVYEMLRVCVKAQCLRVLWYPALQAS